MPYATQSAKNAHQQRWRATHRARRALAGLCRDCPRPCQRRGDRQTVLCAVCSGKATRRRPDALEAFNAVKREQQAGLRLYLQPLWADRRQNGKACGVLGWALEMRRA